MAENFVSSNKGSEPQSKPTSPAFQFILGLGMIVVLLIASAFVGQQESKGVAAAAAAAATTPAAAAATAAAARATPGASAEAATAAGPAPVAEGAPESKDIKSYIADLTAEVKKLHGMVENLPKPEPAVDLKPTQDKLDEMAKVVAAAMPAVEKMQQIEGHVSHLGKQIDSLEANVLTVKQGIEARSRKPK